VDAAFPFQALALLIGLVLVAYGLVKRRLGTFTAGIVMASMNMAAPLVQQAASDAVGFGLTLPLAALLIAALTAFVAWHHQPIPHALLGARGSILLTAFLTCLVSGVQAPDTVAFTKAVTTLALSLAGGWLLIGALATMYTSPRRLIRVMIDSIGLLAVCGSYFALIAIGPSCLEGSGGNAISLFGLQFGRLGAPGMNPTGIASSAGLGLLYIAFSAGRIRTWWLRAAAATSLAACLVALMWSGGRGALAAVLLVMIATWALQRRHVRSHRFPVLYDGAIVGLSLVCALHLQANSLRGQADVPHSIDPIEVFVDSRVSDEARQMIESPVLFGRGYNSLSPRRDSDHTDIESYWLKAWVELGTVGSAIYTLAFAILSFAVIKADCASARYGDSLGFVPTAFVMLTWANSVSSWGFILPYGDLMVYVGIMSCACLALHHYRLRDQTRGPEVFAPSSMHSS
jgi:hypothetical protein